MIMNKDKLRKDNEVMEFLYDKKYSEDGHIEVKYTNETYNEGQ